MHKLINKMTTAATALVLLASLLTACGSARLESAAASGATNMPASAITESQTDAKGAASPAEAKTKIFKDYAGHEVALPGDPLSIEKQMELQAGLLIEKFKK